MGKSIAKLRDMLCRELDEVASKGELSAGDLEAVHKLTDTIKNIDKIDMMEGGTSDDGGWRASGTYSRDGRSYNSYDDGTSSASYGRHWVRGHYSRADGYSRGGIMEHLDSMMSEANPDERAMIQRWKEEMQRR